MYKHTHTYLYICEYMIYIYIQLFLKFFLLFVVKNEQLRS